MSNTTDISRQVSCPITRMVEVSIRPTARELAQAWCDMDADMQAEFFDHIAHISKEWRSCLAMQLQYIQDSPRKTPEASYVMQQIGAYA